MIDDNLKDLYVSSELLGEEPISWKTLYTLFQSSALNSDYACLSAKTFHPRDDKIKPAISECKISENFGSKIFFLNIAKIFKEIKSAHDLFPKDPKLCCEDGFMQFSLLYSNFKVGLISREALLFRRSKTLVNTCKKTVSALDAWSQCHYDESYPEHVLKAYEKICNEIERNKKEYQSKREKRDNMNLGVSTRDSHQRKKATFEQAFDEIECSSEPSKRKKRSESYSMDEDCELNILSDKSMDNSFKTNFLGNLNEFLITPSSVMLKNRPHQNEALLATYKHLNNNNIGYYDMATGVGKSRIFLLLVLMGFKSRRQNQDGLLILLPDLEQINDTYNGLEERNRELDKSLQIDMTNVVKMGSTQTVTQKKWKKNNERKENGKIIISCAPSWQNFMKEEPEALNSYPLIIMDEFHLISKDLINSLKSSSSMVLGFSATPGNRRNTLAPPIFSMNSEEGVKAGSLCPWMVGKFDMDYSKDNLEKLFNQLPNFIKTYVHCHGGTLEENKGLIYTDSIKDAKELEKILKSKGLKAAAIHSEKLVGIDNIKKEFKKVHRDSKVNILITVNMAKKGFDSVVDYEIFAKKNYSLDDAIQMRGRVIRNTTPTYMPSFESDESFDQEFSSKESKDFLRLFPKEPTDDEINSLCKYLYKGEIDPFIKMNSPEIVEDVEPIERGVDKLALIFTFRDAILPADFRYSKPVRPETEFDLSEDESTSAEESKEKNLKILY
jgi:superfamily II DNA or RNA helicase